MKASWGRFVSFKLILSGVFCRILVLATGVCLLQTTANAHAQAAFRPNIITTIAGNGTMGTAQGPDGDNGSALNAQFVIPSSAAVDGAGNIYVLDLGRVRKINAVTGIITTVAFNGIDGGPQPGGPPNEGDGGPATSATTWFASGIAVDKAGNIYIAEFGDDRVRKVDVTTGIISAFAGTGTTGYTGDGGQAASAELEDLSSLCVDGAGNVYIITNAASRIRKVTVATGIITTVAGNGTAGYSGDGGVATSAEIYASGIAVDATGDILIADGNDQRVRYIQASNSYIYTVAGTGAVGPSGNGGPPTSAALYYPSQIAILGEFEVFINDKYSVRLANISSAINTIKNYAGTGIDGVTGNGGPATGAEIGTVYGMIQDSSGNIYIVDQEHLVVRKIAAASSNVSFQTTAVNSTSPAISIQIELGAAESVSSIASVASVGGKTEFNVTSISGCTVNGSTTNAAGTICTVTLTFSPGYAGIRNAPLRVVTSGGTADFGLTGEGTGPQVTFYPTTYSLIGGNGTAGYSGDNGPATSAEFKSPEGLAMDNAGDLFVSDALNYRVRRIDGSTGVVTTVAGNGSMLGATASGGPATTTSIGTPVATVADAAGNLFISDYYDNAVWRVDATSKSVSLYAGGGTGLDGGPAYGASLSSPGGLALDSSGNLYISDNLHYRIRRVDAVSGVITTVAGDGTNGYSGDNGAATSAKLALPGSLSFDVNGNLYVADGNNYRIRKLNMTTGIITTVAGNGSDTITGDGGLATSAGIGTLEGFTLDAAGDIYLAAGTSVRLINSATGIIESLSSATFVGPCCTVLDGLGNIYIADVSASKLYKISPATPSTLTFASTAVGSTSSDSPQTVTVENIGTATLEFAIPGTGNNPSVSTNFSFTSGSSANCPLLTSSASSQQPLSSGASCTLPVSFTPTVPGTISGSLVVKDNAGNVVGTQTIPLNGTGTAALAKFSLTGLINAPALTAQTVTVTAQNSSNATYTSYTGTVHFTSTDGLAVLPANYTFVAADNGVHTFAVTLKTAGSQTVAATDTVSGSTGSETVTVSSLAATVTLGSLSATYDGTAHAATATTSPAGLTVTFTYNGSASAPTAAGSYTVVGTITDPSYSGSATGTLVISKATATVTLGSLTASYDGNPHAATATTTPAGLVVTFTYNGSATAPTAVGSYAVVGTINDANYSGSATGTLVISSGNATVTLGSLAAVYNGSPHAATATTNPAGLTVTFTYNGSATAPTAAGSYTVVGTINDPTYSGSATGTLIISKATATVTLGSLTATYDGNLHAATATTTPAGLTVSFTYNGSATAPTAAGSYAVVGTVNDANYSGSATGTLVISSGNATVTLGSLSAVYNGSAHAATAMTTPAGLTVNFTYNGSTTAPTAVGSYSVVGTISDPNYAGSAMGTLVIGKGTATVTLGSLTAPYDGNPHAATATTSPAGLTVTFTYNGSATAPTAAGSYVVVGTVNDSNYTGSAMGTLVISNGTATVTLGSLSAVYNGSPHAATATTNPAGLAVTFTYNGSATAPTAAGSYTVVGTINDPSYTGSSTGTLVISKATAAVTLSNLSATYNGSPQSATATTTPAGLAVTFTYNGSATAPTAAGSYAVVGTVNDTNYAGSASGTLVLSKGMATVILGSLTAPYDGNPHAATATTTPAGLNVTFTYNGSATAPSAAGSYTVVGTVSDTNYTGSATGTLVISSVPATVTLGSLAAVYDGNPHAATATTNPAGLNVTFTYNGSATAPTAAGSYTVVGTINNPSYTGSSTGMLVISKATATVTLGSLTATYNGSAHAATATTTPTGLSVTFTYNGSATAPTAAGSYTVVGTVSDSNYTGSATGTLVISNGNATVTLGSLAAVYNGSAHAATATTTPAGLTVNFTYNGSATAPTAVGSYTVVGTISDPNYTGSATGTLVISDGTATVALANLSATYDGNPHVAIATTTPAGLAVSLTYNGSATAPTAAGSYAVMATVNDPNYMGSATGTLVINPATATVTLGNLSATYDGNPHAATATTTPAGLTVSFTYAGSSTAPTSVGSYAVVATVTIANYTGSATGTLVISNASATVTLSNLSATYDGQMHAATATTVPASLTVTITYNGMAAAPVAAGSYAVVATVTSANYSGSANGTLIIAKATPTMNLTSSSTSVAPNQTVTLTATVMAAAGGPATGSVIFYDNGTSLGTFPLAGGTAMDTQLLSAGTTHTITATYSGDTNFVSVTSATSAPVIINVAAFEYTFQASGLVSQFVGLNSTVSYTFALTPQYGSYPGQVTFTVVGLPQGATATFSPATLSATAGAQTVTMTVNTSSILSMQKPNIPGSAAKGLTVLALLILPLFTRRSVRRRFTGKILGVTLAVVGIAFTAALTGCGSGINYFDHGITVTATSGSLQHASSVELKLK